MTLREQELQAEVDQLLTRIGLLRANIVDLDVRRKRLREALLGLREELRAWERGERDVVNIEVHDAARIALEEQRR